MNFNEVIRNPRPKNCQEKYFGDLRCLYSSIVSKTYFVLQIELFSRNIS